MNFEVDTVIVALNTRCNLMFIYGFTAEKKNVLSEYCLKYSEYSSEQDSLTTLKLMFLM